MTAVNGGPSWDRVEENAAALHDQGGLNVDSVKEVVRDKVKIAPLMKDLVEETVYALEEVYND